MIGRDFFFGLGVGVASCISVVVTLKVYNGSRKVCTWTPRSSCRDRTASEHLTGNFVRISDLEKSFFNGIDRKADLTEGQVQQLKDFLEGAVGNHVKHLAACTTLKEILHLLCFLKLLQPKCYRMIMTILENSGIGVNVENLTFHVEGLENAVRDLEEGLIPRDYERDQFELDVIILHTEDDRLGVSAFKNHLINDGGIHGLSVQAYEEFCGNKGFISALGDIFKRTRYIFVFMTKSMENGSLHRFLTEMALVESLEDPKKNYRIIPVWTTRARFKVPEMRAFPGVKYWQFMDKDRDIQQIYLNSLNRILVEGRKTFVRA